MINFDGRFLRMIILRLLYESVLFAIRAMNSNKLRTFLSLSGITIGIFAIISVLTVVDSLEMNVRKSISKLGDNVIYIQKWPWAFGSEYPWWKYFQRPLPSYKEMEELKKRVQVADSFTYLANISGKTVKYQKKLIENVMVSCVSHDYAKVYNFDLESGRYFTERESVSGIPVVVLGSEIATNLFGQTDPLGKNITVLGRKLTVIGLINREGKSIVGSSHDEAIIIPVNYARSFIELNSNRVNPFISVKGKDRIGNLQLKDELKGAMRSVRQLSPRSEDNFSLNEASLLSKGISSVFGVINAAGWLIGIFAILVGGFGIANIMFVSVKERTSVIGLQKALGAKRYFILFQFLFESVFLCLTGGVIGLLIVFGGSMAATATLDFEIVLTMGNIVLGLFISVVIGVISGFVPALNASRLDPVVALRS
jgi:putative ABC transport system permease protein